MEELKRALQEVEARLEISVVVLSGSNKAFSAGVDVAAHAPEKIGEMLEKFHAVDEVLGRLRKLSPAALAVTKKAMYAWDAMHFDKGLARAEKVYLEELMKTEDAREGSAAFLEKRAARWKGK